MMILSTLIIPGFFNAFCSHKAQVLRHPDGFRHRAGHGNRHRQQLLGVGLGLGVQVQRRGIAAVEAERQQKVQRVHSR